MQAWLDALNPRSASSVPLSHRLDAASQIAEAIGIECQAAALDIPTQTRPLLQALVPAVLQPACPRDDDDELGDTLVRLLQQLLHASRPIAAAAVALLQVSDEVSAAGVPDRPFALLSLLALALDVDAAAAANCLAEQRHLVEALMSGMEQSLRGGSGAIMGGIPASDLGHQAEHLSALASCSARIFLRVLQSHGTSAAAVLSRADVPIQRLLSLLPGVARGSHHSHHHGVLSVDLLELLGVLAADATLAPAMLTAPVLGALKRPLLSGSPPLQLAIVDVLISLRAEGGEHAANALGAADVLAFLIEMCRREPSRSTACDAACGRMLRLKVRALLVDLAAHPQQASAGPLCSRLIDALSAGASQLHRGAPDGAVPQVTARRSCALAAATASVEYSAELEGGPSSQVEEAEVAQLDAHCLCSLLGWYQPMAPRETARLAKYCERALPALLAQRWTEVVEVQGDGSHAGGGVGEHLTEEGGLSPEATPEAHTAEAMRIGACLLSGAVGGCAKAADSVSLELMLRLVASEQVRVPLLRVDDSHLHLLGSTASSLQLHARSLDALQVEAVAEEARMRVDVASAMATLLTCAQLPAAHRRALANQIAPAALAYIANMVELSQLRLWLERGRGGGHFEGRGAQGRRDGSRMDGGGCEPMEVESGLSTLPGAHLERAASEFAVSVLLALGRLPTISQQSPPLPASIELSAGLQGCIQSLLRSLDSQYAGGLYLAHQHAHPAEASRGAELSVLSHVEWLLLHLQHSVGVEASLAALAAFIVTRGPRLHLLLPPPTLRRLATKWAAHADAVDALGAQDVTLAGSDELRHGVGTLRSQPRGSTYDHGTRHGQGGGTHGGMQYSQGGVRSLLSDDEDEPMELSYGGTAAACWPERVGRTPAHAKLRACAEAEALAQAGMALGAALAKLPAEQSVVLPGATLGWLWRQLNAWDREASCALLVRWAMLHSGDASKASDEHASRGRGGNGSGSSVDGNGSHGAGSARSEAARLVEAVATHTQQQPPLMTRGVVDACCGCDDLVKCVVHLLTSHLHVTQAAPGGVHSILILIRDCVSGKPLRCDEEAGPSVNAINTVTPPCQGRLPSQMHAAFAAAGLSSALGQLCMLLPTSEQDNATHTSPLRLVLRLLAEQMRAAALLESSAMHTNSAAEAQAATHHAVAALLRLARHRRGCASGDGGGHVSGGGDDGGGSSGGGGGGGGRGVTIAAAVRRDSEGGGRESSEDRLLCVELLNYLNTQVSLQGETIDTVAANQALVVAIAQLATRTPMAGAGSIDGRIAAAAALLLVQLLRTLAAEDAAFIGQSIPARGGLAAEDAGIVNVRSPVRRALIETLGVHTSLEALIVGMQPLSWLES